MEKPNEEHRMLISTLRGPAPIQLELGQGPHPANPASKNGAIACLATGKKKRKKKEDPTSIIRL